MLIAVMAHFLTFCTYRHSFSDIIEIQNTQQIIHFLFAIDFNGDGGRCTRLEDNHIQWNQLLHYTGMNLSQENMLKSNQLFVKTAGFDTKTNPMDWDY